MSPAAPRPRPRRRPPAGPLLAVVAMALGWAGAQVAAFPDPPRADLRVVVFGDFNGPYGSVTYPAAVAQVVDAIVDVWRPDLVLLPGDLVAGQSRSLPDERFAAMWDAFDAAVAAPLRAAGIPYAATMGNHDASKGRDAGGGYAFARERDAAAAYWARPHHRTGLAVADDARFPFAWSFRLGPLFVAVVDASGPAIDDAERAALRDALSSAQAAGADLRWVLGHLPLVGIAVGRDREGEVLGRAADLRDLMLAGGVDSYVSGHQAAFYAGRWDGLELLFSGGIGARALRGAEGPARSTVSVVDVALAPLQVRITTYDASARQALSAADLPAAVDAFGGTVTRSHRAAP
jgi:3',5'-cyclic AMP phosphodiesterase CpdA